MARGPITMGVMAVIAKAWRPRLAWILFAAGMLLAAAAFVLGVARGSEGSELLAFTDDIPWVLAYLLYIPVGALVASRHPSNPVGWLMLVMGLSEIVAKFSYEYAAHALVIDPGSLPGGAVMAWVSMWAWGPEMAFLPLLFVLFPTGRPMSRAWNLVGWVPIGWLTGFFVFGIALWPHRGPILLRDSETLEIEALLDLQNVVYSAYMVVMLCIVAGLVSLVVRFRRAHGVERQQLKWIAFVAAIAAVNLLVTDVLFSSLRDNGVINAFGETLAGPGIFAIAAGIAILKYRLYDIDRIINRALVYGALTALLGLVYVSVVGVAGSFGGDSSITVAGTTLAVAAMFQPARRHIQAFIDRRFYRRKYDAQRTLDSFSARLRDEIDIDALTDGLMSAVRETVQPATLSVWFPADNTERSRT